VIVRPIGSRPTNFIGLVERAASYEVNHSRGRRGVELRDGRQMTEGFFFPGRWARAIFAPYLGLGDVRGRDIPTIASSRTLGIRSYTFDARASRIFSSLRKSTLEMQTSWSAQIT
jgi:hypothetical protein